MLVSLPPLLDLVNRSIIFYLIFFFFKQKTAYEMAQCAGVQTCALPISGDTPRAGRALRLRQAEDPNDPSLTRMSREIGREIGARPHIGRIVRTHVAREQEPVAVDPRVHRHVLPAVGSGVGDRTADDARSHLELPQQLTRAGIGGLEPAVERAVEHDV